MLNLFFLEKCGFFLYYIFVIVVVFGVSLSKKKWKDYFRWLLGYLVCYF